MFDGTVASRLHDKTSPNSDHRPTPHTGPGKVRAIDITCTDEQGKLWTEAIRRSEDARVLYVIYDGRRFSSDRSPTWTWQPYLGLNPHEGHFHVSMVKTQDNNGRPWSLGLPNPEPDPEPAPILKGDRMIGLDIGKTGDPVVASLEARTLQAMLKVRGFPNLEVNGEAGDATRRALHDWKITVGITAATSGGEGVVGAYEYAMFNPPA
jgi:hypothetical protein